MRTEPVTGEGLRTSFLPGGEVIRVLGQGTWGLAEHPRKRPDEIAALQLAVDLGMNVIDTAEMYAGGAAEFLLSDHLTQGFANVAGAVRKGGTALPSGGSMAPEHPMWLSFARGMSWLMMPGAPKQPSSSS